jgi:hypothetical protein
MLHSINDSEIRSGKHLPCLCCGVCLELFVLETRGALQPSTSSCAEHTRLKTHLWRPSLGHLLCWPSVEARRQTLAQISWWSSAARAGISARAKILTGVDWVSFLANYPTCYCIYDQVLRTNRRRGNDHCPPPSSSLCAR